MHLHKNLEEKNLLAFLVTLIKVIAPWVAAAVVIHYLNVYNEKKYPEFYNLDDKKTPQSLFENLEIGYPFELAFIMYISLIFSLGIIIGAYVDGQLDWFVWMFRIISYMFGVRHARLENLGKKRKNHLSQLHRHKTLLYICRHYQSIRTIRRRI